MKTFHCKKCQREFDAPADLLGMPNCSQCRGYCYPGKLPSNIKMRTTAFPSKKVVVIQIDDSHGVAVSVEGNETKVIVSDDGNETEYKFPH